MIIRITATAFAQCMARTQAGWTTLAGSFFANSSAAARLDMAQSSLNSLTAEYTAEAAVSLLEEPRGVDASRRLAFTKKRAGFPRLASSYSRSRSWPEDVSHEAGISTVSTTWITPFD